MLGKLLKYEWKSTGRVLPLIYLAVLVLALCVGLSLRGSMYTEEGLRNILFISVYIILIVAMIVVTVVVIVERFYRSMISQEGYLMHTLPVKSWEHIISKACMAVIWGAIAVAIVIASFFIIGAASGLLEEVLAEVGFGEMSVMMEFFLTKFQFAMLIVCGVVQIIRLIMQLYLSMAIGGAAVKNKIAYSFLAFIVISIIVSVVASAISMGIMFSTANSDAYAIFWSGLDHSAATMSQEINYLLSRMIAVQLTMDGGLLVVFYMLTNYFLGKKLNLE